MPEYITTYTGVHFYPTTPNKDDIRIEDVAHSLSLQCRGNGHVQHFLSVGQHCIRCCREALARGYGERIALICLLHDASEAYMSDVPRPTKQEIPRYVEWEDTLLACVYDKFLGGQPTEEEQTILKKVDDDVLYYDLLHLLHEQMDVPAPEMLVPFDYETFVPFKEVEEEYLRLFRELTVERDTSPIPPVERYTSPITPVQKDTSPIPLRVIRTIGIVGAGTMGYSMSQIFARYGFPVILYNHRPEKLQYAQDMIAAGVATLIREKKLTEAEGEALKARITYTTDMQDLSDIDLVVENVAEVAEIKKQVFAELSQIVPTDAILSTNTSGLSINMLAEAVTGRERFLGFHWLNPSHIIPLIEIIRNDETCDEAAQAIYELAKVIHKKPAIVNRDVQGFVVNRLQLALYREALDLLEKGIVSAEDLDSVLKYGLGFRWACLGPLETMDFGGVDVFGRVASYLMPDLCDSHKVPKLLADAVARGHLGVKTGQGFYTYTPEEAAEKTRLRDERLLAVQKALGLE